MPWIFCYVLSFNAIIFFLGYVVQGSTGEYSYLSTSERIDVVNKVKSLIPSNKLLIAGSGCECKLLKLIFVIL